MRAILDRNAATDYGQRHDFGSIACYEAFRERVPVVSHADIAAEIERVAAAERGVLTTEQVIAFEETGGSTGGVKQIPYTERLLASFRSALLPWLDDLAHHHPAIAYGSAYWAISPAARPPGVTPGGIPVGLGADAAYFGQELGAAVAETLAVPQSVAALADIAAWRDETCLALLARDDLVLVSIWSPTFLLALLDHIDANRGPLARALRSREDVPLRRRDDVCQWLQAGSTDFAQLWPSLVVLSCWDQASSRPFANRLRERFARVDLQGKGLLATEGVITVPLAGLDMPVLAYDAAFFEFMRDDGRCVAADAVVVGEEYRVVLTTEGGLYRYAIGDRVRVHGHAGEAPLLAFVGRGDASSDLCGEKLTDAFVAAAIGPLVAGFALLAPRDGAPLGYVLHVDAADVDASRAEALARAADLALGANPQYAYARALGQLAPLTVSRLDSPMNAWVDWHVARGRRLGDVKPPALSAEAGWQARLAARR